ncbi:MAG: S8 family serine peptidase [Mycobacterium leprae]
MRQSQIVRRRIPVLFLALLLVSTLAPGYALTAGSPPTPTPVAEPTVDRMESSLVGQPIRLLVQLQGAPLADDSRSGQAERLATEQERFRKQLRTNGISFHELSAYRKLFNGLAITLSPYDAGRVATLPGVSNVYVSHQVSLPRPDLRASVDIIKARQAWDGDYNQGIPGVDGYGVIVAEIDTGIDYTHPDLGGCFGPDCRVIWGYDFVGDTFTGGPTEEPQPDEDPMDIIGHGTHVAGIIGANQASPDGVTGVAPGVSFIALKVFGRQGSTWDDIILQALETAYDLKVDIVNMSLGAPFLWPQSPTAQAVERLARKGIFVAASAGNEGASGEFAVGAPAVGSGAVAVASLENDFAHYHALQDPNGQLMAYEAMTFSPSPPESGQSPELVYVGLGAFDSDFLDENGNSIVEGKVALIARGAVTFQVKSLRAKQYGAVQAIIFNNQPGFFFGTLGSEGHYIPTVSVTREDGQALLALMANGPVTVTWTAGMHPFANPKARLLADSSSAGPGPDLSLKPDLTAPGASIYSTYPVALGGYASLSGTSMASPHVAGAAALLLQARREMFQQGSANVKASALRTMLMNTAVPQTDGSSLYPVHLQGAGLIDVWAAITAQQRILPDKVALGPVQSGGQVTVSLSIENLGAAQETYRFDAVGAGEPAVTIAPTSLAVNPGRTGRVKLQLTVPEGITEGTLFSGWIQVRNGAGAVVARVPYLGFLGDYQAAPVLDPVPPLGLPWLAELNGLFFFWRDAVEIHPNCGCDRQAAWILYSLARQGRELQVEIWSVEGRKWGLAFQEEYLPRYDGGIDGIGWTGYNDKGKRVPAGTYLLRLRVLHPLGDPRNPAHWDEWVSGPITVIYD